MPRLRSSSISSGISFKNVEGSEGSDVVSEENSDRRELYALIAKETSTSAEQVAKQAAQKNFNKAKKGEFLKYAGKWRKKA